MAHETGEHSHNTRSDRYSFDGYDAHLGFHIKALTTCIPDMPAMQQQATHACSMRTGSKTSLELHQVKTSVNSGYMHQASATCIKHLQHT
jgi:hypothetical protein